MSKKNDNNYYVMFEKMASHSLDAAKMLHNILQNFNSNQLAKQMDLLHGIEHDADVEKHEIMKRLIKEFLPPIEREDIISLTDELDQVTDNIEDVLLRMYMFNITEIMPEALNFAEVIVRCCEALCRTMSELHNFRRSSIIQDAIVEVNFLEEEGDRLYTTTIRNLYAQCKDPLKLMTWTEIYNRFEKCCDSCEHVANVVETIIAKNS